ncbi:MAG: AraC family transcriptional regulator [Oscillospiraceae bacterium]|nr:AraC family transcriptional regulator [Oscillospiraceae bacterium]
MDNWEKIIAAQYMQDYIEAHLDETMTLEEIGAAAGYSKWHTLRLFKEVFHRTPFEYIRAVRLTKAAKDIKNDADTTILDIALDNGFDSHEGFSKAFRARFGLQPSKYRAHNPRRYFYFEPSSIVRDYLLLQSKEYKAMSENQRIVTVTIAPKPDCKLILKRGIKSEDYFAFDAEMGCDWWEILETVPGALDKVVFLLLPPHMIQPGTSKAAVALEMPADYSGEIPEGFEVVDLPSSLYMHFNGAPYEEESWYGYAHEEIGHAIANYKPELYGYEFAEDLAPTFTYGASAINGCRTIIPVRKKS